MARVITLIGFKQYEKRLRDASTGFRRQADAEASAAATNIANEARNRAPHFDGKLRASIHTTGRDGRYEVLVSANYAAYIEFGTRSRVRIPPELAGYAGQFKGSTGRTAAEAKKAIYEWCRKKGIEKSRWWFIFISIMVYGIRAQPFLFPSVDAEQPRFYARIRALLNDTSK